MQFSEWLNKKNVAKKTAETYLSIIGQKSLSSLVNVISQTQA